LEVALVVTNQNLEPIFTFEKVVFQEQSILDSMDAWCTKHHGDSGLTAKVPSGEKESVVESQLIDIFSQYSKNDKAILAGNSIGQDRKFIDIWMPQLSQVLHYRMLDVSSFKIVFEGLYKMKFEKQKKHRAIDDILESIAELKYYLQFIDRQKIESSFNSTNQI
jgi:oligoribonuclease